MKLPDFIIRACLPFPAVVVCLLIGICPTIGAETAPAPLWAVAASVSETGESAVDSEGNSFVTGTFSDTAVFGPTNLISAGSTDGFVAKYDRAGNIVWARAFGGAQGDSAFAAAIDGAGNVYVTGYFNGTATFAPGVNLVSAGTVDVFVAKFSSDGTLVWAQRYGKTRDDLALAIDIDSATNVVVSGIEMNVIATPTSELWDAFTAKFSPTGVAIWSRSGSSAKADRANGVAADALGNVYSTGYVSTNANFGGTNVVVATNNFARFFLVKYATGGEPLWVRSFDSYSQGADVIADGTNGVYVTGLFNGPLQVGAITVTNVGQMMFLARYNSSGELLWLRHSVGGFGNGIAVAIDAAGNPHVAAAIEGTVAFANTNFIGNAGDVVTLKYDANGQLLWADQQGGTGFDFPTGLSFDSGNNLYMAGQFTETFSIGTNLLTHTGPTNSPFSRDLFLARFGSMQPEILREPSGLALFTGENGVLTVDARGELLLSYQWWHDAQAVVGGTNASLPLNNVEIADAGDYRVVVTNHLGSVTSLTATVVVTTSAPFITLEPQSRTNLGGTTATFNVEAHGSRPLFHQWRFNGTNLPNAINSQLTLPFVLSSNAGPYQVVITNGFGAVTSEVAVLTVHVPPLITAQPVNQSVHLGTNVTMTVGFIADTPVQFQWFFNFAPFPGRTNSTLLLSDVQTNQSGWYSLAITNDFGWTNSNSAFLQVNSPPSFTLHPISHSLSDGDNITLSVAVSGSPTINYSWRKNGSLIPPTNAPLILTNVQAIDAADYHAVATSQWGTSTSAVATLTIERSAPVFVVEPQDRTVLLSSNVLLTAIVKGTVPIDYQWFFEDTPATGGTASTLAITNAQTVNDGYYTLIAENAHGIATSRVARVIVDMVPSFLWVQRAGGSGADQARGVAVDTNRNVYVTGSFHTIATFGATNLTSAGSNDVFLAKYTPGGALLWVRQFGGASNDFSTDIALDPDGNVFVTGINTTGTGFGAADFGGPAGSFFIGKFDSDGNPIWARTANVPTFVQKFALAVDSDGNAVVTGSFMQSADFGGTNQMTSDVPHDVFIVKYDAAGSVLWSQRAGGNMSDSGTQVSVDSSGDIFVTGTTARTAVFGGITNYYGEPPGGFLAKFNSNGNLIWVVAATNVSPGATVDPVGLGIDAVGNAYWAGSFARTVNFAGSSLTSTGNLGYPDVFIAKVDPDGNVEWLRRGGGTGYENTHGLAVDPDGACYVLANPQPLFNDPIRFGNLAVTNVNGLVVVKCDSSGEFIWIKSVTGSVGGGLHVITADPRRNVYLAGDFSFNAAFFDSITLMPGGNKDIYLTRIGGPRPPLTIVPGVDQVTLRWPHWPLHIALENTTALLEPGMWESLTNGIITNAHHLELTLPSEPTPRFFRLRLE